MTGRWWDVPLFCRSLNSTEENKVIWSVIIFISLYDYWQHKTLQLQICIFFNNYLRDRHTFFTLGEFCTKVHHPKILGDILHVAFRCKLWMFLPSPVKVLFWSYKALCRLVRLDELKFYRKDMEAYWPVSSSSCPPTASNDAENTTNNRKHSQSTADYFCPYLHKNV